MRSINASLSIIVAAILIGTSSAEADLSPYWVDSYGNYVRDSSGSCVRTSSWPKDNPVAECGDKVAEPEPVATAEEPAPVEVSVPEPEPVVVKGSAGFESGSNSLTPEGKAEINRMAKELETADIASIVIIGHTDSSGPEEFNLKLSEKRAEAVREELIADGIDPNIVEARGMGETQPIADNSTVEGRAKNRRVEINVNASKTQ